MNLSRDMLLKELGLSPIWRLRQPLPPSQPDFQKVLKEHVVAAPVTTPEIDADWPSLSQSVKNCVQCAVRAACQAPLLGAGDLTAEWLIVADAPMAMDDAQQSVLAGDTGLLFDNMLVALDRQRSKGVYLTYLQKCAGAQGFQALAAAQCLAYLHQQIALIQPKLVWVMGEKAAQFLLKQESTLDAMRGKIYEYQYAENKTAALMVTYHPAALLQHLPNKAKAWDDLLLASKAIQNFNKA